MIRPAFATAILSVWLSQAVAGSDEDAIRHVLHDTFDRSDARLTVEPVVVASDYGIAGWTQGDMGGRALLRRKSSEWVIVLCSGDALKSADALTKAAVPPATASVLAQELARAEAGLEPKIVAQFSRFEGLVMMDETGQHPPHQK